MILVIDNYDSFTYNLVHYLLELGAAVEVVRNDALTVAQALAKGPQAVLLSPGPKTPDDAGICLDLIRAAGATPVGVTIALDRLERASANGVDSAQSAVQQVQHEFGLRVVSIATLGDLLHYLSAQPDTGALTQGLAAHLPHVQAYRDRYGV